MLRVSRMTSPSNGFEVGDAFGGADFCGAVFDLVVVIRCGVGEVGQVVYEAGEHVFDGVACFGDAGLELGLLEEDFLEPALGVVQRMLGERFVDDVAHDLDLGRAASGRRERVRSRCRPSRRSRPSRLLRSSARSSASSSSLKAKRLRRVRNSLSCAGVRALRMSLASSLAATESGGLSMSWVAIAVSRV